MQERQFDMDLRGLRLNALEWQPAASSAPPLVLLHDALGSVAQWRQFPLELAARTGRRVIAYDRAGHGRSAPLAKPRDLDYLEHEAWNVLPDVLQALDITAPVLMGHSDGGTIALLYAARYPAAAVVAEAPHVFVEDITLDGIRQAVEEREVLIQKLEKYHGSKTASLFDAWAATWLAPDFRSWDIRPLLSAIPCPVLAIQGLSDPFGSAAQALDIAAALGNKAQPWLIHAAGHQPHREMQTTLIEGIARFLGAPSSPNHNIKFEKDETIKLC
jgi:pimeloyl-ACP methyl ester carboxylesterase